MPETMRVGSGQPAAPWFDRPRLTAAWSELASRHSSSPTEAQHGARRSTLYGTAPGAADDRRSGRLQRPRSGSRSPHAAIIRATPQPTSRRCGGPLLERGAWPRLTLNERQEDP